jgi:hypothetical protein
MAQPNPVNATEVMVTLFSVARLGLLIVTLNVTVEDGELTVGEGNRTELGMEGLFKSAVEDNDRLQFMDAVATTAEAWALAETASPG